MSTKALLLLAGFAGMGLAACGNPNPAAPELCAYSEDQSTVFNNEGMGVSCSPVISGATVVDTTGAIPGQNPPE